MKANELMIGDWVKIKDLKDPIKRISCIDEHLRIVDFWDTEKLIGTSINNVLPVSLTEEVLEKNGFADDYDSEYDMSYTFAIPHPEGGVSAEVILKHNEGDAEWVAYLFGPKGEVEELIINYVHELQHALQLFGIEKEIIL